MEFLECLPYIYQLVSLCKIITNLVKVVNNKLYFIFIFISFLKIRV